MIVARVNASHPDVAPMTNVKVEKFVYLAFALTRTAGVMRNAILM
jgi:hypothetical protein